MLFFFFFYFFNDVANVSGFCRMLCIVKNNYGPVVISRLVIKVVRKRTRSPLVFLNRIYMLIDWLQVQQT